MLSKTKSALGGKKVIAIVGLAGSGKSEASDYLVKKLKSGFVRLGQLTLDEVKKAGLKPTEKIERQIRENLRKKHGMAAFAKLNFPKIDRILQEKHSVIVDGLYSWEEYLEFLKKYTNRLIVVAIYASPKTRYRRLSGRTKRHGKDQDLRFRSFSHEEAQARDYAEVENLDKAGPITMADYTVINEGKIYNLKKELDKIVRKING